MSKRKRRALDPEALQHVLPDIIRELDLEICFRQRLAKTIESRITWALFLQESLQAGPASSTSTLSYRDVAIDTLSAIEAPSEFLFAPEADRISLTFPQRAQGPSRPPPRPKLPVRNPSTAFLYIRSGDLEPPHDENHVQLYLLRCPTCFRTTFTSLQGLLNHARISHSQEWGSHDECVRACAVPDPNMDVSDGIEVGLGPVGILPGLRSLFRRAVGVHLIHGLGADSVEELSECQIPQIPNSGSHLARTLGLHKDTPALAPFLGKQATRGGIKEWDTDGVVNIDGFEDDKVQSTQNNDWARNLVKGPKSKRWRMPYMHRNDVEPITTDLRMDGSGNDSPSAVICGDEQTSGTTHAGPEKGPTGTASQEVGISNRVSTDAMPASGVSQPTLGTRFHFVARIIITDRSLWIPIDRRKKAGGGSTHMWMISVDSPSYSHRITTILQRMTVTSLTNPSQFQALTKSNPPFAVIGMASEPFLAKVELGFSGALDANGQMTSQTMVLEHWVELDLVKYTTPAVGEEQVVDMELDKATVLIPARTDFTPIDSKVLWNLDANGNRESNGTVDDDKSRAEPTEGYAKVLTSLLGRFPMTLKDTPRGRPPNPPLPYKLVSTPAQLKNVVLGRRKAIEWGRARAIRDAYSQAIEDLQMSQEEDVVPLTTADVFIWLSEQGHFLKRPAATSKPKTESIAKQAENKQAESWCSVCGQDADIHLMTDVVKREAADSAVKTQTTAEDETKGDVRSGGIPAGPFPDPCTIVLKELHATQMPVIDVQELLRRRRNPHHIYHGSMVSETDTAPTAAQTIRRFRAAQLVAVCDPQLCLAVERAVAPLRLSTFTSSVDNSGSSSSPQYPIDLVGPDKAAVETHLAPYAMLSLATQRFIRVLIEGGLDVAKGQKAIATGLVASKRRRKVGKEKDTPVSLLTPAHVINSIVSRRQRHGPGHREVDDAIFGCLARLRVPVDREELSVDRMVNDMLSENVQEITVKTEQS